MYTLIIWTIVAGAGGASFHAMREYKQDWRPITSLGSATACHEAARQLGYVRAQNQYRCINNSTGASE